MKRLLLLILLSCAEAKNQAKLGLFGSGSAYHPEPAGGRPTAGPAVGAAIGQSVGAAIGAAAVSRAMGGCVASCPPGTACDPRTGFCERLPCRGQCAEGDVCVDDRCVTKVPLIIDSTPTAR